MNRQPLVIQVSLFRHYIPTISYMFKFALHSFG